ncbi:F-box protein At2g26160-like [Nicotiana tomentosiformis]|uniref:F-box protein At2g26160-like n=1 Tax=Nicotiana tomentosiformis TaxID=4098 RepID=UPI00051B3B45|nr:uncharacterized protein LOC104089444 [Nicotiana tomentosiformis]
MDSELRSRDWAGLPDLVLNLIFQNLSSISDYFCFGAVCKPWFSFLSNNYDALQQRVNSSSIEELPLLMFCTDREQYTINTSLYSAAKSKIICDIKLPLSHTWRCFGSSHGWLAFQQSDFLIQLFNPFSRETIYLPRLNFFLRKIIITKNPSTNPYNFDVATIIVTSNGYHPKLAFLKPGGYTWVFTSRYIEGSVCDMIYYNEKYYVVNDKGKILSIDKTSLELKRIIEQPSIVKSSPRIKFYLVKTRTNELLRVQIFFRRDDQTSSVKIFKLVAIPETQKSRFVNLDNLGDEALFLSNYSSMSVLASNVLGCEANFVYYLDNNARLELPGNQYMMDIIHLQYGGRRTQFPLKASIDGNALALWIIPTPKFTSIS